MSGSSGALYGLIPQRNPTFTLIVGFRGGFWYAEAVANRPSTQPNNYLQSFNQDQAWVVLIPDLWKFFQWLKPHRQIEGSGFGIISVRVKRA